MQSVSHSSERADRRFSNSGAFLVGEKSACMQCALDGSVRIMTRESPAVVRRGQSMSKPTHFRSLPQRSFISIVHSFSPHGVTEVWRVIKFWLLMR
jgi:hypothetical protein